MASRSFGIFWSCNSALRALALDAEAVGPAAFGLYVLEMRVGRISKLGAADAGEAGSFELLRHPLVVPHPEVSGAAKERGGHGFEAARDVLLAEVAVAHKARGGSGGGGGE